MGKKYIIELEDKPFHKEGGDFLYRVKGFNSLVFDLTGIGKLTPYTEPDLEQVRKEAYDKGYDDAKGGYENGFENGMIVAWDAARKIIRMPEVDLLNLFTECYSAVCTALQVILKYDAPEAIEKIRQYEQAKEEKQHTWIFSEVNEPSVNTTLICSKCGYTITIKPGDTQALNFCPKCGDNKRGERDE